MLDKQLTVFQIRILLKCEDKPISQYYITNSFRKYTRQQREDELAQLVKEGMLEMKELPKKGTNKIPTFYFITEQGKLWVEQYQANYPE